VGGCASHGLGRSAAAPAPRAANGPAVRIGIATEPPNDQIYQPCRNPTRLHAGKPNLTATLTATGEHSSNTSGVTTTRQR
jgi:hypothetical protein